jgi:hypothetical protein
MMTMIDWNLLRDTRVRFASDAPIQLIPRFFHFEPPAEVQGALQGASDDGQFNVSFLGIRFSAHLRQPASVVENRFSRLRNFGT